LRLDFAEIGDLDLSQGRSRVPWSRLELTALEHPRRLGVIVALLAAVLLMLVPAGAELFKAGSTRASRSRRPP
jgi:hypothetical protein